MATICALSLQQTSGYSPHSAAGNFPKQMVKLVTFPLKMLQVPHNTVRMKLDLLGRAQGASQGVGPAPHQPASAPTLCLHLTVFSTV